MIEAKKCVCAQKIANTICHTLKKWWMKNGWMSSTNNPPECGSIELAKSPIQFFLPNHYFSTMSSICYYPLHQSLYSIVCTSHFIVKCFLLSLFKSWHATFYLACHLSVVWASLLDVLVKRRSTSLQKIFIHNGRSACHAIKVQDSMFKPRGASRMDDPSYQTAYP